MRCGILKGMKALVQLIFLITLAGCASPYRAVYTSAEGDYYIEERSSQGAYYVPDSVLYSNIGFDPWWMTANPALAFIYYNPAYYPYYLAAWNRLLYQPYFGYYPGYYTYWCPPYRTRHGGDLANASNVPGRAPVVPLFQGHHLAGRKDLLRSGENRGGNTYFKQSGGATYKPIDQTRSMKMYPSSASMPALSSPAFDSGRSGGFEPPSARARPMERSSKLSDLSPLRSKN